MNEKVYLLLDNRLWEHHSDIQLVTGELKKDSENPLFGADKPWEFRLDNMYANVVYDDDKGIFRCWYSPFESWSCKSQESNREVIVCYAQSRDGLNWTKPENNIVIEGPPIPDGPSTGPSRGPHGTGVMLDLHGRNRCYRFKALFKHDQGPFEGRRKDKDIYATFSKDGLVWTMGQRCSEIHPKGNTHHSVCWDPRTNQYVGVVRRYEDGSRNLALVTSDDFETWHGREDEFILRHEQGSLRQPYAMILLPYCGIYIGLLMMYQDPKDKGGDPKDKDTVDCELAWSPDLYNWERVTPGCAFIPRDQEYDSDCVFAAAHPVIRKDGIWIYYAGSSGKHNACDRETSLSVAHLGHHRFAGIKPAEDCDVGSVTTRALDCEGPVLEITADAPSGEVRVSVVDSTDPKESVVGTVKGNATNAEVQWEDDQNLESFVDRKVRLEFELHDACLYAFKFGRGQHD